MTPGRNDPCPCGSGRKYKRCCGAVIPIRAQPAALDVRECADCTVCCTGTIVADIYGFQMGPGHPCRYLSGHRCGIYERRPPVCKNFVCGWLAPDSPFPDDFRPDKLGVLIVRTEWRGRSAYILRAAARDPDEALLDWMKQFSMRTGTPFFYEHKGEKFGFGPEQFQQDMLRRAQRGEPMW